jgi:hypothetical protein
MDLLAELIQEISYGISGPPQPGDTVVEILSSGTNVGAHAEWVAEAG